MLPNQTTLGRKMLLSILVLPPLLVSGRVEAQSEKKAASPQEFAIRVLDVYRTKDVAKLLALSPGGSPPANVLSRFAPGTGRYKSLFGDQSWRWQVVQNWNRKFGDSRFQRSALVRFSEANASGKGNFVSLDMESGKWRFSYMTSRDVKQPGSAEYQLLVKEADPTRMKELQSAASNVLKAFQERDVDAVLKLSVAEGPYELQARSDEDRKKPKSDFLFSEEQMAGVANWKGEVRSIHIREAARVEFGRAGSEVFVVTMIRQGREWRFEDIHSPDVIDFDAWDKD